MARPMLREAPVTSATLPASSVVAVNRRSLISRTGRRLAQIDVNENLYFAADGRRWTPMNADRTQSENKKQQTLSLIGN
jgi:hypothetical protein